MNGRRAVIISIILVMALSLVVLTAMAASLTPAGTRVVEIAVEENTPGGGASSRDSQEYLLLAGLTLTNKVAEAIANDRPLPADDYHQSSSESQESSRLTINEKGLHDATKAGLFPSSPQSLDQSFVEFNPLSGGDECFYPETSHTFCFWAESNSTNSTWADLLFMRFPNGWNISNVVDVGPTLCDNGGNFGELSWLHYFGALNEVSIDQLRAHELPSDRCYTNLCVSATTSAVAEDAAVSWYWSSDQYGDEPWFPCSSDGYTPRQKPACDQSLNPPAVVPVCYIPPPLWQKWINGQLWSDPTELSLELGDTFSVVDTFNTSEGFLLEESWVEERLALVEVIVHPASITNAITGTGSLILDVPAGVVESLTITKTFQVLPSTWISTVLEENLSMGGQLVEQRPVTVYKQAPGLWIDSAFDPFVTAGNMAHYTITFGNLGGYENDVVIRSDFMPLATFFTATVAPNRLGLSGLWAEWDAGDLAKDDTGLISVTLAVRAGQPVSSSIPITNAILNHTQLGQADVSTVTYQVGATTPLWQKTVNGQNWNLNLDTTVETADTVVVVDTVNGVQPLILQDNWNEARLALLGWTVEPDKVATVGEGNGSLDLELPGGYEGSITLHKYFAVAPSTWASTTVDEDLYWAGQILESRPITISKASPQLAISTPGLIEVTSPAWTSYTISYTNSGGYENDVSLLAEFPPEVAFESSSPTADWVRGDQRAAEWQLGDLANQSAGRITVTISVSPGLVVSSLLPLEHAILNHLGTPADSATTTLQVSETMPLWEKWVDGQPWTHPFTHTAETFDTFQVVDVFNTLLPGVHRETWDPGRLQLVEVTVWPAGLAEPQLEAGALTLAIPAGGPETIEVTKLFHVLPCTWTLSTISETFTLAGDAPIIREVQISKTPAGLFIAHDHNPQASPGSAISYTLSFGNAGGYENDVSITATFPAEAAFDSASPSPDWVSEDRRQARWMTGDLANGDSAEIVVFGSISAEIARSTTISVANEIADHTSARIETSTVLFEVNVPNYPPIGFVDSYTTAEDVTLTVAEPGVLANDSDANGDLLSAILLEDPAHGQLALVADGSFVYTPTGNYAGPDHFQYLAYDGFADSGPVTVTLAITPVNDLPIAGSDLYTTTEDGLLAVAPPGLLTNDWDIDGITLTAVLVDGPEHGALLLNPDGSFVYTPTQDYFGLDTFTYQAWDELASSNMAEVQIEVDPVNDPPVAYADTYTGTDNTKLLVYEPGVLGNDIDIDSAILEALLVDPPLTGDLRLNLDGSFVYTPTTGFSGQVTYTYQAADLSAQSAIVPVTITILATNDPPIAQGDYYSVTEDGSLIVEAPGVLGNDSDPDGNPIGAYVDSYPNIGILFFFPNGSFEYTPNQDQFGIDNFSYHISDGLADSGSVTVTIEILPVNDPPLALADVYTTDEDLPLVIAAPGVLANDQDIDSAIIEAIRDTEPGQGNVALLEDGSFVYTPTKDFFGQDAFSYHVFDGEAHSSSTIVTLTVLAVNDPPLGVSDRYTGTRASPLQVAAPGLLANDWDVEGDPLTAQVATQPEHGTLEVGNDGSFVYTPTAAFSGQDIFSYFAMDDELPSLPTWVTLTILVENRPPLAVTDAYTTFEDYPLELLDGSILVNDSDPDGNLLQAVLISSTLHGELDLNATGTFVYTPTRDYYGTDHFYYQAYDGHDYSEIVAVQLHITPVNDPPIGLSDLFALTTGMPFTVTAPGVLANDSDVDGDILTAIIVDLPLSGTVALYQNGGFVYIPDEGFIGHDHFSYRVSDGILNSAAVIVNLTVEDKVTHDLFMPLILITP